MKAWAVKKRERTYDVCASKMAAEYVAHLRGLPTDRIVRVEISEIKTKRKRGKP